MARLKGLLKIQGTLDELTFYKTQDGNLVKTKGGVSKQRIATDPNFLRTRENGAEFGNAAAAGKLLRVAVRNLMMTASDNRVTSRVTQVMTLVKNHDLLSLRGKRNVGAGIATTTGKVQMQGFDFNMNAPLASILFKTYTVNVTTGVISMVGLVPATDISFPAGATHVTLRGGWSKVDFVANTTEIEFTNATNLPIGQTATTVTLTPAAVPAGTATGFFLLAVEFFQSVNGVQYVLNNGAYNALAIIQVA
jgi:hypothetical protein